MALRAFRSNPALGGFGGESSNLLQSTKGIAHDGTDENHNHHDAFGQIIKELVDNAVDACSIRNGNSSLEGKPSLKTAQRVRVIIEKVKGKDNDNDGTKRDDVLRVTVSDNGCGMKNIEDCVEAFRSTKASKIAPKNENEQSTVKMDKKEQQQQEEWTAGRYGIGLTLCLLHAQRLVPNSCASITSAPTTATHFIRASYVVDTEGDSVRCVKREMVLKNCPQESGTSVSLLVPGGRVAQQAWPRLAEYFARFQLSPSLGCSLEVMAPSLSSVPLFVRPSIEKVNGVEDSDAIDMSPFSIENIDTSLEEKPGKSELMSSTNDNQEEDDESIWNDGMVDEEASLQNTPGRHFDEANNHLSSIEVSFANTAREDIKTNGKKETRFAAEQKKEEQLRVHLLAAATKYLKLPIELKNVAQSIQTIRCTSVDSTEAEDRPLLEVDMIAYAPEDRDALVNGDESDDPDSMTESNFVPPPTAKIMLVRMVNRIPLLDGAEASACGLVQGLCSRQSIWTSFGLQVTPLSEKYGDTKSCENQDFSLSSQKVDVTRHLFVPTYAVRDSDQVAPFFQNHAQHSLFGMEGPTIGKDCEDQLESCDEDQDADRWEDYSVGQKRSKREKREALMPAHLRIGNILVIVQIHAKPSCLPLPTLSKGRLPLNNKAIDDALEVGLRACLRSLQKSNPKLLLTAQQLKQTERDARYCPAVAAAISSIVCKSSNGHFQRSALTAIQSWKTESTNLTRTSSDDRIVTNSPSSFANHGSNLSVTPSPCQFESSPKPSSSSTPTDQFLSLAGLGSIIEERIRLVCKEEQKPKKIQKKSERSNSQKKKIKATGIAVQVDESDTSVINSEEFLKNQDDQQFWSKSTTHVNDERGSSDGSQSFGCNFREVQKSNESDYETDDDWW